MSNTEGVEIREAKATADPVILLVVDPRRTAAISCATGKSDQRIQSVPVVASERGFEFGLLA